MPCPNPYRERYIASPCRATGTMYRSLLRFFPITPQEALSLLYALYIGNLDTCHFAGVPPQVTELTADGFCSLVCAYAAPIPYGGADVPLHARTFAQHPL